MTTALFSSTNPYATACSRRTTGLSGTISKGATGLLGSIFCSLLIHVAITAGAAYWASNRTSTNLPSAKTDKLVARLSSNEVQAPRQIASSSPHSSFVSGDSRFIQTPTPTMPQDTVEDMPPSYAAPDALDQMATVIEAPDLPLPPGPNSASGQLRMKLFVSEEGTVDNVELIESNFTENYVNILLERFHEARLSPGLSGGTPVKSWRIVEIYYTTES